MHPFHPRLDDWGGENERTGVTSGLIPSTPARERIGKKSGRGLRSRVSHSPNVQGDERERDAQSGRPPSPPPMREWKRRRPPLGWPFFMSLLLRPAVRVRASHMLLARTAAGSSREVAGATVPTHRENREKSGRLPQADHRTGGRHPHSPSLSYPRHRESPQGSSRPPQLGERIGNKSGRCSVDARNRDDPRHPAKGRMGMKKATPGVAFFLRLLPRTAAERWGQA